MQRLWNLVGDRNKKKPVVAAASEDIDVILELSAHSNTSKSSPSRSSSSTRSRRQNHRNRLYRGSSQIFRRVASANNPLPKSCSIFPSEDESSQVSSLDSPLNKKSNEDRISDMQQADILTLQSKKESSSKEEEGYNETSDVSNVDVQAHNLLAYKGAEIRYLSVLVKELKSQCANKLELKDLELSALRLKLNQTHTELSKTKKDLEDLLASKDAEIRYLNILVKELKSQCAHKLELKDLGLSALRLEPNQTHNKLTKTKKDPVDQLAYKDAENRYLSILVKELKSQCADKLELKDLELSALRFELNRTHKELSQTKTDLVHAIEGHARLVAEFSKKTKEEDSCSIFPLFGKLQFAVS